MKQLVLQLQAHPTFAKVWHWVKLIAITGGAQAAVQAMGMLSGILIIRLLPVEEYALYTLANTMLGTMTVLADGGISTGVMAEGGKVWQDKEKLGIVIATGLDLRRKFAIGSLLVSIPILVYLLQNHGASVLMTLLIIASLIPAFFAALSDSLLQVAPKLHQDITPLQRNQMTVSVIRLLLSGLTLFIFPWTFVALLANGIPIMYGNSQLREINLSFINNVNKPSQVVRKEILKTVYKILPTSIYYCFSGQIMIWILSILGNSVAIAHIGALGRFSIIFTFISSMLTTVLIPRFARMTLDSRNMLKFFIKVQFVLFSTSFVLVLIFYLFSDYLLWVLGNSYSNLKLEFILVLICAGISMISQFTNQFLSVKKIIINPIVFVVLMIFSQLFFLYFIKPHTTFDVLVFNILAIFVVYIFRVIYFFKTICF
ncbi:MAG: lipopolysaccharide biosynthesis protein [Runella zeae]